MARCQGCGDSTRNPLCRKCEAERERQRRLQDKRPKHEKGPKHKRRNK